MSTATPSPLAATVDKLLKVALDNGATELRLSGNNGFNGPVDVAAGSLTVATATAIVATIAQRASSSFESPDISLPKTNASTSMAAWTTSASPSSAGRRSSTSSGP